MTDAATKPAIAAELKKFGRERFSPGTYSLDLSVVKDINLRANGMPSTFLDAYCHLRDSKIEQMPDSFGFDSHTYVTDKGDIELKGDWRFLSTMRTLIELTRQGIEPHHVMWFYYGHDWSRDADEIHDFFAVYDGKFVMDACNFSSEEPLILKKRDEDSEPIWHSHPYFDKAMETYWYRRFYTETMTGQLMVLRPDEPILYHYERPQRTRDIAREIQLVTLVKMYRLLWVAIPLLAALAFPSFAIYFGVAAALLAIDVLWRCWATRKIGQDR